MKLVLATRNLHKAAEVRAILRAMGLEATVLSLADFPEVAPPEESGASFLENARIKARRVSAALSEWVVADDSGLVVPALDGRPGIHSARYAGPNATDAERIAKLLKELEGVPLDRRTAAFHCAMVLAHKGRVFAETEAVWPGQIAEAPAGTTGFGYDPIFLLPKLGRTVAQLDPAAKNQQSHRARALRQLLPALRHYLEKSGHSSCPTSDRWES